METTSAQFDSQFLFTSFCKMFANRVVFFEILNKLNLNEIVGLRSVCSSWKNGIDDYLSNVKTLILTDENYNSCYTSIEINEFLNIKLINNFRNSVQIVNFHECFEKNVTKLFPNIQILCILFPSESVAVETRIHNHFLCTWKSLQVIFLLKSSEFSSPSIQEPLNRLESLERLIVFSWRVEQTFTFIENQFLQQIQHLYLPSIECLQNVRHLPKLVSLGFYDFPNSFPENLFSNIKHLNLFVYKLFNSAKCFCNFNNFLKNLHDVARLSLCSIEFRYFGLYDSVSIF